MVSGRYVKTFAEASHALPDGMHMNADYPFMLPRIVAITATTVTLQSDRGPTRRETREIRKSPKTGEFVEIAQASSYETIIGCKPTVFRFTPFKDERSAAIGSVALEGGAGGQQPPASANKEDAG